MGTWSISPSNINGVSINSNGELTLSKNESGDYREITVTYTDDNQCSKSKKIYQSFKDFHYTMWNQTTCHSDSNSDTIRTEVFYCGIEYSLQYNKNRKNCHYIQYRKCECYECDGENDNDLVDYYFDFSDAEMEFVFLSVMGSPMQDQLNDADKPTMTKSSDNKSITVNMPKIGTFTSGGEGPEPKSRYTINFELITSDPENVFNTTANGNLPLKNYDITISGIKAYTNDGQLISDNLGTLLFQWRY